MKLNAAIDRAIALLPNRARLACRARRYYHKAPELRLAVSLCRPDLGAIDIGANTGLFSYFFARHAAWCVAFEPNSALADELARALPAATVHAVGLAGHNGEETLSTPIVDGIAYSGFASMANSSALAEHPHCHRTVPVRRLDDFDLHGIGLIKIDVEGFEEQVLAGGLEKIVRDRPILLIEIEDRHNPGGLKRIIRLLSSLGYGLPNPVNGAENNFLFVAGVTTHTSRDTHSNTMNSVA